MSDQPKPTDWTQEWLRQYLAGYSSYDLQLKAISDAHNAALASETEARKVAWRRVVMLEQQLAARDAFAKRVEKQLAAEREKRENSDRKWIVAAGQLRRQLADALAKIGAK